jgi:hypothetical protein
MLQGDGDALHGELTPILKSLLEKVNDKGELNATQAKSAVWGLRKSKPEEIRQYFNELAAMDLAEVQGTGSRLTLKSKVLRNTAENLRNIGENLRNIDENLRGSQQHQTHIYQEVQEINLQTHDVIEAIQLCDSDAVESSVDEFSDSEKTSTSSSFAKIEAEDLTQQGTRELEESSSFSSSVEDSSSFSSTLEESLTKPSAAKKPTPRILELGDRVVVKDVGGRYQGVRGVVTEIRHYSTHTGLIVKFDKEVAFVRQDEFIAGDLIYLAPGQ